MKTEEEDEVCPLTLTETVDAQCKNRELKVCYKKKQKCHKRIYVFILLKTHKCYARMIKIIIPTSLRRRTVSWYHHYLQHPGHLCLEGTMRFAMYWKGMGTTIRRYVKTCRSCQVNKKHSQKYGHLPPKLVIPTPWKELCVDLIGPYTLEGKDSLRIDFMCLAMINPATSWFKIVELPTVTQETAVPPVGKGKKVTFSKNTKVAEPYFEKSSAQISNLVYKS
jgi:hypothetical protein